jgi:3',5'-cyclic AMP phosphodiesterase CpdA
MRKLLHVSDVHFGPPHRPEVSAGVLELVADRRPDLVVVAGDLTQRAKPRQFREARQWVDRLTAPSLTVPGNHDVPMYRFWERALAPFGAYSRHFSNDLEPTFEDDELFVCGINSANNWTIKDGRLSLARIERLADRLAAAPVGKTRIAVIHHELIPAPRFGSQKILTNAERVVEVLAAQGVALVLSGHLHQAYCARAESYYPGLGSDMLVVHSGTTTSSRGRGCERGRNTGYWIEVAPERLRVVALEWDGAKKQFVERSQHDQPSRSGTG